jgi:hypothetical protein
VGGKMVSAMMAVGQSDRCVGSLSTRQPEYVVNPPIEAVVFGWGVNEDSQLVCVTACQRSLP